ncbi:helix-turn-helix transcriptional regulator [Saccharopolyspora sp. NPDC050389]|uniref:helix-turn-helix domain-containing protein n=1 Tax=Saccharopolyspora sp. NPDC050389 TaxID=3155516 RepID=UPI00340F78E5
MSSTEDFGSTLEARIQARGLSRKDFADLVGVTPAAVSSWTTGRVTPRPATMHRIEEVLGGPNESDDVDGGTLAADGSETLTWYHRPAHRDGGRELGNAAAFAFDTDLAVLAREATQNSLDERFDESEPVRVRYALYELSGERLRSFLDALRWDEIEPHVRAAASPSNKVGRILQRGLADLRENDRLVLLRIDDYNASGLTGPDYDDGRFSAVIRRQLDSRKESPNAGGSYGLGKAVLWATSKLGLVLVNSRLSETHEGQFANRMIGRLELPWRSTEGGEWAGPAWFGEPDPERGGATRSWWGDSATARRLHLERSDESPGTSFLIVGAHDPSGEADALEEMHEALVKALASNFWASMVARTSHAPMLEASVVAERDGEVVIPEQRVDPHLFEPTMTRALQAFLDGRTTSELTAKHDVARSDVPLAVPRRKDEDSGPAHSHEAVLLVTRSEDGSGTPNRLVGMRGNRMVVVDGKIPEMPLGAPPVQAVLLAGRAAGGEGADAAEGFLRAAEPPEHNDWKRTDDLTSTYARGAATRIADFRRAWKEAVHRLIRLAEDAKDDVPPALTGLLDLDAPPMRRSPGFPTVKDVSGAVQEDGSWRIAVDVQLPVREDPWVLDPILRFATRSGPKPVAEWSLEPTLNCDLAESGSLVFSRGVRHAGFVGTSDPSTHPVTADMAVVEVELRRTSEVSP